MGQGEAAHKPVMQTTRVQTRPRQPTADGGLGEMEDARGGAWAKAFGHRVQDLGDPDGRGSEKVTIRHGFEHTAANWRTSLT